MFSVQKKCKIKKEFGVTFQGDLMALIRSKWAGMCVYFGCLISAVSVDPVF